MAPEADPTEPQEELEQLELIHLPHIAPRPRPTRGSRADGGHDHMPAYLAETNPVARVLVESHVPHLDRPFDYGVPRQLDAEAVPGTRVRVRFGGQQLQGWLIERTHETEVPRDRLQPLIRVQSALPVLTPDTYAVARSVAARSAGVVADVLRAAVPPRVASVEKQALTAREAAGDSRNSDRIAGAGEGTGEGTEKEQRHWSLYDQGADVIQALRRGERTRAVVQALPSHPEHDVFDLAAQAVAATHAAGRGAVVVVGDAKALDRIQAAVQRVVPEQDVARLHSDDKPTPRYRAFVQVLEGQRTVALGTRPAVWAPVADPGLVIVLDDGDPNLVEQRAPYHHARDVALLRAEHEDLSVLLMGHTVTPEAQRLVDTGWATAVQPTRDVLRANMPRIVATSDSWHQEHDSLASRARLPETAFRAAREALERGPVLVQVARTGYAPSIACERCRTAARCTVCDGPLSVAGRGRPPVCGWCGREAHAWACSVCRHPRWRMTAVGSQRTAEELGRAFPQVPVVFSSGDTIRRSIGSEPALVVATPGAEPWAEGGYAAALLLDGDRMLSRPGLRVEEATLRRWFEAAALVRSGNDGGTVVVTSEHERAVSTLVRWDPAGHAIRELAERRALQLPPAVRSASLVGSASALQEFLRMAQLPEEVRVIGPAPVGAEVAQRSGGSEPESLGERPRKNTGESATDALGQASGEADQRVLLFFGYSVAGEVTARLRATRAQVSALRRTGPVRIRCDIADLL